MLNSSSMSIKRLAKTVRNATVKVRQNRAKRKRKNALRRKYKGQVHSLSKQRQRIRIGLSKVRKELQKARDPKVVAQLEQRESQLIDEIWQVDARLMAARKRRDAAVAAFKRSTKRTKWWIKRKTVYRRRLKRAKKLANPKWESWMANGADDYAVPAVLRSLARGVVHYDLAVTSIHRNHVPAGGSTTSYHLYDPSKAGDIAGARMEEFQRDEYKRNKGNTNCLELMGPDNGAWLKHGAHMSIPEGDPLETLHDTHAHLAFN